MATLEKQVCVDDFLSKALADLQLAAGRSFELKHEQEVAIKELLAGKDVLAVLPTGFVKSLIYQTFVRARNYQSAGKAAIIVISPLNSIIRDQLDDLETQGYSAVDASAISLEDIRKCEFKILFATAEMVRQKAFREILKDSSSPLHQNIAAIVVDESHTVETWTGKRKYNLKSKRNHAFREAYGELAVLRSLCREGVPVLALTGTADEITQQTICKQLCLKPNSTTIFISPNRINLRICVSKVKKVSMNIQLDWLIEEAKLRGQEMQKTIIFCNTLKDIASVVNLLLMKLGKYAYIPAGSNDRKDFIIGIFHSVSWAKQKEQLLNEFKLQTSKKIIIVASSALSMGVNFPDVRYVINWGPARTLLDQLQEAGRAGRDGKLSHVITIYHGHQLSHCEEEIKDFVKTTECYRVAVYRPFDPNIEPVKPGHDCCSHCAQTCNCNRCGTGGTKKLPFENKLELHESNPPLSRPVSNEDKKDLRAALTEVLLGNHGNRSAFGGVCTHGFSSELVDDIVSNCHNLFTIQDIVSRNLPVYSVAHSLKILEIIQEIFQDIPNFDSALDFFAESGNYCPEDKCTSNLQDAKYFMEYFDLPDGDTDYPDYVY